MSKKNELAEYKAFVRERLDALLAVVQSISLGDFSAKVKIPEEEDEFTALAVGLEMLIDKFVRLFEETQRKVNELAILNEIGQQLNTALREDEVVRLIHEQAGRFLDMSNSFIALYREETDTVEWVLGYYRREPQEMGKGDWQSRKLSDKRGFTELVISLKKPFVMGCVAETEALRRKYGLETFLSTTAESWLGVPMIFGEKAIGMISVHDYERPNLYGSDQMVLMQTIANQAAIAIQNAWLFEKERRRLDQLQAAYEEQQRLVETVRELSTPIIPIHKNILVLPLVGGIDTRRAQQIMEVMLSGLSRYQAEVVIIDITGVSMVDTGVANHLLQATKAASLLGARCVLVGLSPEVAQTVVRLGIDLSSIVTRRNLQAGIEYALGTMGLEIISPKHQTME